MKKSDIKPGMIVQWRNGTYCIVLQTEHQGLIFKAIQGAAWNPLKYYSEDTIEIENKNHYSNVVEKDGKTDFDIIKVGLPNCSINFSDFNPDSVNWIWSGNDQVELTLQEIAEKFGLSVDQIRIKNS